MRQRFKFIFLINYVSEKTLDSLREPTEPLTDKIILTKKVFLFVMNFLTVIDDGCYGGWPVNLSFCLHFYILKEH